MESKNYQQVVDTLNTCLKRLSTRRIGSKVGKSHTVVQKVLTETPQHFCTQETETKIKTAVNEELQAVEQELKSLLVKAS